MALGLLQILVALWLVGHVGVLAGRTAHLVRDPVKGAVSKSVL